MLFCTPAALLLLLLLAAAVAKEIRSGIKRLDLSLSLITSPSPLYDRQKDNSQDPIAACMHEIPKPRDCNEVKLGLPNPGYKAET
jgi:hypothetical protein